MKIIETKDYKEEIKIVKNIVRVNTKTVTYASQRGLQDESILLRLRLDGRRGVDWVYKIKTGFLKKEEIDACKRLRW